MLAVLLHPLVLHLFVPHWVLLPKDLHGGFASDVQIKEVIFNTMTSNEFLLEP